MDGSFHSPEWHAARLASLKTSHTITWEEYKQKQKEDQLRKGELEKDTHKMMREYRAQLDAERARKLAQGRNHSATTKSDRKRGNACLTPQQPHPQFRLFPSSHHYYMPFYFRSKGQRFKETQQQTEKGVYSFFSSLPTFNSASYTH